MSDLLQLSDAEFVLDGEPLLKGINLTLKAETLTVILGANGAGKTMLMKLCHGLNPITTGEVRWRDGDAPRQTMVFQKPVMLHRTVLANIAYPLRHLPKAARVERARDALAWAQLTDLADHLATSLSVGQTLQVAIARAWALQPGVIFLDEPTASLDPHASHRVEGLINSMRQAGIKVIMTTHNLAQAKRLADDVVFIEQGTVLCHQASQAFFAEPSHQVAKDYLHRETI